jgi:RHS repeat-associated protein
LAEVDGLTGETLAEYIHGPAYVDDIVASFRDLDDDGNFTDTNEQRYHLTDQQHSTVALLDTNGDVIERYGYDAFGAPSFYNGAGTSISESAVGNHHLYTGREYLPELGLYDYRQRHYDPALGRFLTTDPVYDPANLGNPYTYVGNNPGAFVDPYGLWGIRFGRNGPNIGVGEATLQFDRSFFDFSQGDNESMEELASFAPVIGWVADARILKREVSRGQYVSATFTAIGFVPLFGDAVTGVYRAADKGLDGAGALLKSGKKAGAVAEVDAVLNMHAGRQFDRVRSLEYPANQVRVDKPGGGYTVLDSYNPELGEIVSRKHTQFANIQEETAMKYIRELPNKYPRGARIQDVPNAREAGIAGDELQGIYYLEVPVQDAPIPQRVLDFAERHKVTIRDISGREY